MKHWLKTQKIGQPQHNLGIIPSPGVATHANSGAHHVRSLVQSNPRNDVHSLLSIEVRLSRYMLHMSDFQSQCRSIDTLLDRSSLQFHLHCAIYLIPL